MLLYLLLTHIWIHTHTYTHSLSPINMLIQQLNLSFVGVSESLLAAGRERFLSQVKENKAGVWSPSKKICCSSFFGHVSCSHQRLQSLLPPVFHGNYNEIKKLKDWVLFRRVYTSWIGWAFNYSPPEIRNARFSLKLLCLFSLFDSPSLLTVEPLRR